MSRTARTLPMTRRRMVAASGAAIGAPLLLAACGSRDENERSEGDDPDLLNSVLAQHLAVLRATQGIDATEDPAIIASEGLMRARTDSIADLEALIAEREGTPTTEGAEEMAGESRAEGLTLQLETSIEVSLEAIGGLSAPAYRQAVHRFITEDAAAVAALRSVTGDEIVPDAFVFGPPTTSGDSG